MRNRAWRNAVLVAVVAVAASAASAASAQAAPTISLDDYSCAQFVADMDRRDVGERWVRSMLMAAWATGYAAAYQKDAARADADALQIVSDAVAASCRTTPDRRVVDAVVKMIEQFTASRSSPEAAAQPKAASPARAGVFNEYTNYDMDGGDIRKVEKIEQQGCAAACTGESTCKGYSYDKWNKYCYLKNQLVPLVVDPSSVTAIRASAGEPTLSDVKLRLDRRIGRRFSGQKIRDMSRTSPELCQSACEHEAKCLGYSFLKREAACQLFGSIETSLHDPNANSAVKTQARQ